MPINYLRLRNQASSLRSILEDSGKRSDAIIAGHLHMLEILAFEHNWTQNASARNQQGDPTSSTDPAAVAWDLLAAASIAAGFNTGLLLQPIRALVGREPTSFNDDPKTRHEDVIRALATVIVAEATHPWIGHDITISEIVALCLAPPLPARPGD